MYRLWEAGISQSAIAKEIGAAQITVSRVLREAGYELQRRPSRISGENHGSWKGGRTYSSGGYVLVVPDLNDSVGMAMRGRTGYVMEHRLAMARALGRPLTEHETVHHINGDVTDNHLENLQLRQGKHGNGVVMICADCGSHNIVATPLADTD